jgi:hypothetical protein
MVTSEWGALGVLGLPRGCLGEVEKNFLLALESLQARLNAYREEAPLGAIPALHVGVHRTGLAQRQSNSFVTCYIPGNIP